MENSGNNLSVVDKVINYVKTKPIRSVLIFVFIVLPILSAIFGTHSKNEKATEAVVSTSSTAENKDKSTENNVNNSNTQENNEKVSQANVRASDSQEIPKFVLACSTGSGPSVYRVVSDGSAIYFASVLNEQNLDATKKSINVKINNRTIEFELTSRMKKDSNSARLHRDSLDFYTIEHDEFNLKYSPKERLFNCQTIEDFEIANTLKFRYEKSLGEAEQEKKTYDARPNKV